MSADSHGNTPAAWTAVAVALVGFVVGGVGLMTDPWTQPLFWAGVALQPIAIIVWQVMEKMGMGTAGH